MTRSRYALLVALLATVACGPASGPTRPLPPIASVHARKCGACHVPPQPGTRSRAYLEDAFRRHQRRVHLTPDEWRAMVDYLAAPAGARADRE